MIKIINIRAEIDDTEQTIRKKAEKILGIKDCTSFKIVKKAVDARKKNDVHYIYSVEFEVENETELVSRCTSKNVSLTKPYQYKFGTDKKLAKRPVIVGFGPAGMFCALVLAQNGYKPIVLERGKCVEERAADVRRFQEDRVLDEGSNVQFGEGGAGTFSDGKLTTGIKDERIRKVLDEFVKHGAPEEILYLAKPHIGTDRLRRVVASIRGEIISLGGEVRFSSCMTNIITDGERVCGVEVNGEYEIQTDNVVIAAGHSARDTFEVLKNIGVDMVAKPFSVGVRIEHSQEFISKSQYGEFYRKLPAADYKLAVHLPNGRSAYTFCMCPGGEVIASASEKNSVVTNGMSNFARDGKNANSALLIGVSPEDYGGSDALGGVEFQRKIEKSAFVIGGGNYSAPAQLVGDFLAKKTSACGGDIEPTYKPDVKWTEIDGVFPEFVSDSLRLGILEMDKRIKGFAQYDAVLTAPETRSSSPVRLVRDKDTFCLNIRGLYSAGEGGGHAGGITSAAVDGIKTAEKLVLYSDIM